MMIEYALAAALMAPRQLTTPELKKMTPITIAETNHNRARGKFPASVSRWSALIPNDVDEQLRDFILHIIWSESGGNAQAVYGQHLGLMQFNDNWGSREQRLDPQWSINRVIRAYEEGGYANLRKHWCQWHRCRW